MEKQFPCFSSSKPYRCTACGSNLTARIQYGIPSAEVLPEVESGEIALVGCCATGFEPSWECLELQYPNFFRNA